MEQIFIDAIEKRVKEMSLQADFDTNKMKVILSAIILNDLILWAGYNRDVYNTMHKLVALRDRLVTTCPSVFNLKHMSSKIDYTNVNLPQSDEAWDRIETKDSHMVLQDNETLSKMRLIYKGMRNYE